MQELNFSERAEAFKLATDFVEYLDTIATSIFAINETLQNLDNTIREANHLDFRVND